MTSEQPPSEANTAAESRAGERSYFRSQRTVLINNHWYFMNRETAAEGPFRTKQDADDAVERYIELITSPLFDAAELQRINTLTV